MDTKALIDRSPIYQITMKITHAAYSLGQKFVHGHFLQWIFRFAMLYNEIHTHGNLLTNIL